MSLKELQEKRSKVAHDMQQIHEKAAKEDRGFTTDEDAAWAAAEKELDKLDAEIKRSQKLADIGAPMPSQLRGAGGGTEGGDIDPEELTEARVFNRFLRCGVMDLNQEERSVLMRMQNNSKEIRAFAAGTSNTGGYTVPQDFLNRLEIALKAYGGMMDVSEIIRTDTGATLPMPTFNYTGVVATIVGENVQGGQDSSTPFGVANLGSYTYRSPILPVSYEFLQDSAFGEDFIVNSLSDSIARGVNAHATTGTGSSQPRGLMIDATSGKVGTTGQTTSVIYDDLVDLEHSVDPLYRKSGSKFMMHDSSFKVVRKMKDSQGRPIYLPGYDGLGKPGPDTILGYEVVINQDMATMAANAKSIAFGRLDKYKLRIVKDVAMLRLTERYADYLQVAFMLFMRADGRLLDAGTNPVKYYQNSAT